MKNTKIKKILIPVDFTDASDNALAAAASLAVLLKSEIYLVHVFESSSYSYTVFAKSEAMLPSFTEIKKSIGAKLEDLKEHMTKKYNVKCSVVVLSGHMHSEIYKFSKKKKIDMIVMGTHGASGYKEFFIGSNAQRVVTIAEIPVLTIPVKAKNISFKNILIPIDNSIHSRSKVNIAMVIADQYDSNIHLIGLPNTKDPKELAKFNVKMKSVEKIIDKEGLSYSSKNVQGKSIAEAALNYATKNKCDLIVINTGHESKTTGMFLGTFSQQIVNHSSVPVLSLKHPEGEYKISTPGFAVV